MEQLPLWKITYDIPYILDSDKKKWGSICCGKKIFSPNKILEEKKGSYIVLICGQCMGEIASELEKKGVTEYYSEYWMNNPQLLHVVRKQDNIPQKEIKLINHFLEDEKSKFILQEIIGKRKAGIGDYSDIMTEDEYFNEDIFRWSNDEVYVDAGAYDGDSITQFIKKNHDFKKIYAFEADKKNFELLSNSYIYQAFKNKIKIFNQGVWNRYEIVRFMEGLEASSNVVGETTLDGTESDCNNVKIDYAECVPLDEAILEPVTFIKMDIEGSEMRALMGAKKIITTYKPKLAICIYHKLDDLWKIPQYIHSLVPEYKLFIRHHSILYVDTVLYATI